MARTAANLVLALAPRQKARSSATERSLDEMPHRHCVRRRLAASSRTFIAERLPCPACWAIRCITGRPSRLLNRVGRDSRLCLVQEQYPARPVGGLHGAALAFAVCWLTGASLAHAAAAGKRTQTVAEPAPAPSALPVVEAGRLVGETTAEKARRDGLTLLDLSDDWLPHIFSEEPGKPQPLRPALIALANGRLPRGSTFARAREDRYFEAFGIFPSLNLLRRRLADARRHACHDRVNDKAIDQMSPKSVIVPEEPEKKTNTPEDGTSDTPAPEPPPRKPLSPAAQRAVIAMQAHLRCEGLLPRGAKRARMDPRTVAGLQTYQRMLMIADNGRIDLDTRTALLADSREHDYRALLRALRERVVDATGLLEDGSAMGVLGEVQGRPLDSNEFRPLPVEANASQAAVSGDGKVTLAPDLISPATHAASQALGWTSPEAVLASTLVVAPPPSPRRPGRKVAPARTPLPLPAAVALRLPPLPAYHGPRMQLRAEIDRGEVVLKRPALDKDGKKKWRPPVSDRPTLTLYARVGEREIALCRWPTTIGGWKTIQRSDGTMALKYKQSVTGEALWPEILATPTWHPSPGMPTRRLLVKRGDGFAPKTEVIGPGYRAAYGLVAITHHQIERRNERGEPQLMDYRIRTHGTPAYRSVKRGESSGCHRLHNHLALRLSGFVVRHYPNVRHGIVPEDYVRRLQYEGQEVALETDNKGYRFELTPPISVTVLDGDVRGNARAVKGTVPINVMP
jgi:hypothetical protein